MMRKDGVVLIFFADADQAALGCFADESGLCFLSYFIFSFGTDGHVLINMPL